MIQSMRRATLLCAIAGVVVGAAAPSVAQVVVVDPYYAGPYGYGYASPYGAYGYVHVPSYRGRGWEYPIGEDNTGRPYFRSELGWQPGPPGGAPANPCWSAQRDKNLC